MGTWNISIKGHGIHHNRGREDDADRMVAEFVQRLIAAGHGVNAATFTLTGSEEDMRDPEAYLARIGVTDKG